MNEGQRSTRVCVGGSSSSPLKAAEEGWAAWERKERWGVPWKRCSAPIQYLRPASPASLALEGQADVGGGKRDWRLPWPPTQACWPPLCGPPSVSGFRPIASLWGPLGEQEGWGCKGQRESGRGHPWPEDCLPPKPAHPTHRLGEVSTWERGKGRGGGSRLDLPP